MRHIENSATWACFNCRVAVRRPADFHLSVDVPCPSCGRACQYLGDKARIPLKQQEKAWRKLHGDIQRRRLADWDERQQYRLESIRRTRERIALLESRGGDEPNRAAEIKELREWMFRLAAAGDC